MESLKYAELRRRSQDEIEELTREINRLKMHIKNHRNDNETRYIELNRTIKILSSKSDLHAELMQCRHELQLERLLVENLRRDVEAYQSMLGAEQSKCERMKHDLLECEASCRRSEILQSLESVPGLSPAKLIEIFSGRIQSLEKELQQSKLLNRTPNLMPSSTPNDEYSEEIKRALVRKQGDDFLPSLNNALLIQKIFDLEIVVREQNLQIQELMQDSTTKGEVTSLKTGEEDVQNTSEKLLLLAQESLSQARNEVKHLKFQLELCQDREAATRAQLCSLRSTILCVCCQRKIENFDPPSNEEVEEYRDESLTLVQENENLKSLVRERTTQVTIHSLKTDYS